MNYTNDDIDKTEGSENSLRIFIIVTCCLFVICCICFTCSDGIGICCGNICEHHMGNTDRRIYNDRTLRIYNYYSKKENFIIKDSLEYINETNTQNCSICLEKYKINETIIKLNCKHEFHKECLEKWLQNDKKDCPLCRSEINV